MSDHQIHQVIPLCPRLGDDSLADRRGQLPGAWLLRSNLQPHGVSDLRNEDLKSTRSMS